MHNSKQTLHIKHYTIFSLIGKLFIREKGRIMDNLQKTVNSKMLGDIGNRVRKIRMQRKMTQRELAEKVMVSSSSITRLEKGQTMVSVFTIIEIAKVLGVPISDILVESAEFNEIEMTNLVHKLKKCSPQKRRILIQSFEHIVDATFFDS